MTSLQGCLSAPMPSIRAWCVAAMLGSATGLGASGVTTASTLAAPQNQSPITDKKPAQDTSIEGWTPKSTTQADDRKEIRSIVLGCRLLLPSGSQATHTSLGDGSVLQILDAEEQPPKWATTIRILKQPPPKEGDFGATTIPTPETLLAAFIADSKRINPDMTFVKQVLESTVAELPAALATAEVLHSSGRVARYDWYFVQTGPNRFLQIECLGDKDRWSGPVFDSMLESLTISDEFEIADQAQVKQERGADILRRVDQTALRTLLKRMPEEVWYRMHAFDAEGRDIEFGYAGVSVYETGPEGIRDLTPKSREGRDTGLLVRIRMRQIPRTKNGPVVDIDHRAWLSWDREEETWTMLLTARQKNVKETVSESITGFRPRPTPKNPRRWLEVLEQSRNTFDRQIVRLDVPMDLTLYLSEAERLLLPTLLQIIDAPACEFGIYSWNDDRKSITRRLERWSVDEGGRWTLQSRAFEDARQAVHEVGPDGIVDVRVAPTDAAAGGIRWTRMDPEKIREMYARKGIQLDD
ncbi:MAG: hypothetical protein O3A31_07560 [Planctomycetota bacterium]|nr:hypothetical protein [Planctomycetota bacterium]